jgi:DNA-binding beta-propeller fold protein YncE
MTADAGQNWVPLGVVDGNTVNHLDHVFAIGPTSFPVYAGSQDGVYRLTHPNGAWQRQSSGPALYCTSVAVDPLHPNVVYAGGSTGLTKSTDGGDTFVEIGAPRFHGRWMAGIAVDPANSDVYVTLKNDDNSQNGGIWRSTDGGDTWTDLETPANISGTAIVLDPTVERVYAGLDGLGVATGETAARSYLPLVVK